MKKKMTFVPAVMTGLLAALVLSGCGKANNANPKPEDYIELGQYKGLDYVKASGDVTEEEILDEMNYLAASFATEETLTEGKVEVGDVANIDYVGKLNGEAFSGGTASGYDLKIGSHNFIDGFEDGLVGVSAGDTVDLDLTFPENYGSSNLAGQDVVFTVTVNYIKRSKLPEITDDFIVEISQGQYSTVKEYKEALSEQIKAEKMEYENSIIYSSLLDMAVDNATVKKDIPDEYIQVKVNRLLLNAQDYAASYGISYEEFLSTYMEMTRDEYNAQAIEYAKGAAKESLVIQAIANAEGLAVSDDDLEQAIEDSYDVYGYSSAEEFRQGTDMEFFREYILTSKIEEFLFENANITEK